MSLIRDDAGTETSWFQKLCARVVKSGPIPRHVAFIMDGNRRFATKRHMERIEGHTEGFHKLAEVLKWCQDLDVKEVTVYAFSAENFKRSKDEVDSLMELVKEKFSRILEERDRLAAHGVRINVVGELHLLPRDVQQLAGKLHQVTRANTKSRLNICLAYTSRLEMSQAVRDVAWGVEQGLISPEDVSPELFDRTLEVPTVDLLIRTSGEVRLSDYLLWQSSFSFLSFLKSLWPEFSIWDFYGAVLQYQRSYKNIESAKRYDVSPENSGFRNQSERLQSFLKNLNVHRDLYYDHLSKGLIVSKTTLCPL